MSRKSPFVWRKSGGKGPQPLSGKRYPSGKLRHPTPMVKDEGSPELLERRAETVAHVTSGKDIRTENELGRLWIAGEIDEDQYKAGQRYAQLHLRVWGEPSAPSNLGKIVAGEMYGAPRATGLATDADIRWQAELYAANLVLDDDRWVVTDVVVYGQQTGRINLPQLRLALTRLSDHFTTRTQKSLEGINVGQSQSRNADRERG